MPQIKGSVTITYDATNNTHTIDPSPALLDRAIQLMQWNLVAPENWRFSSGTSGRPNGIEFFPAGNGYTAWPGTPPVRDEDGCQMTARVNRKVNGTEKYGYDVWVEHVVDGTLLQLERIDPDIENQPQP